MGPVDEVVSGVWRIRVPLPGNPLKHVNSYVVRGGDRALIVDTGMGLDECYDAMIEGIRMLELDLERTDFFITHLHPDHIGLVGELASERSAVYLGGAEVELIKSMFEDPGKYWSDFFGFYVKNGFPEGDVKKLLGLSPSVRRTPNKPVSFRKVGDGDPVDLGGSSLLCVSTPGHSPAHTCLYDPNRRILFSGDHVLFDITPNISWWPIMDDPLRSYLESLDRVGSLDVELVLPGHRGVGVDLKARVEELKRHHERRLEEAYRALDGRGVSAWEVAKHISWKIRFRDPAEAPPTQKLFMMGETLAHLEHLVKTGLAIKRESDGIITYARKT